jgi:hypothetical protein
MDSNFEPDRDDFCLGFPALYEYVERRFADSTGNFKNFVIRSGDAGEESAGAGSMDGAGGQQIPPCRGATRRNDKAGRATCRMALSFTCFHSYFHLRTSLLRLLLSRDLLG